RADAGAIDALKLILAELNRMSNFIQTLLAYGRVGSGDIKVQTCDCAAVLNDVRRNLMADLERNSVELSSDPLPAMRGDPVLIRQLFQNLIENSIKYRAGATPRIHISAVQEAGRWQFTVRDNGIGIRAEDFEKVFKPFYQARDGKLALGGVGLGLATCKRIVERHGGSIEVQSKPGEGTTFLFTIPQASIALGQTTIPAAPEPAAGAVTG